MKKFSFLLSVILVFCLAFVTSCSSFFSSNKNGATVSFRLNQDVVKALASKVSSSRAGIPAELEGTMLYVTLYVNSEPLKQETPLTEEGAFITFEDIVVGSEVSASVEVKKDSELLAAGTSSESLIVQKGENLLSVTLQFVADGQIFFGDHVTIQLASASDEIWLNQGEWSFKLLDDSGNDILADVDWEAKNPDYPSELANSYLLSISPSIRKGHSDIVTTSNSGNYFITEGNKVKFAVREALPEAGSYELTITVFPNKQTYINKSGKEVAFPQFEPVSGTFDVSVVNKQVYTFNITNYTGDSLDLMNYFQNEFFANKKDGAQFKIYGYNSSFTYRSIFNYIKSAKNGTTTKFHLDLKELASSENFIADYPFQDVTTIVSIVAPDGLVKYDYALFSGCSALESIVLGPQTECFDYVTEGVFEDCISLKSITIPASVKRIENFTFKGCSALEDIIFENPNGWYASTSRISGDIDYDSLEPVDFSTTAKRLQLVDQNGLGAKYLYRKAE